MRRETTVPQRPATSGRPTIAAIGALSFCAFVLAVELWTLVPAPNLALLALAVIVPELSPWGIAACLAAGYLIEVAARGPIRTVGLIFVAFGCGCALVPLCLLPTTIARCDSELRLALAGFGSAARAQQPASTAQPYSLLTALGGYAASPALRTRLNLPVITRDGARLGVDVYSPLSGGPHPTLIIIYGGAWIFGSRADSAGLARRFATLGYTAIAADYRHAPQAQFPQQIDDIRDTLAAVARHARAWDVDPRRVAIFGRSAGAELALLAAYDRQPLTVRAVIAYYAPIDLIAGYHVPPQPDPADVRRILRTYLGGTPEERRSAYIAGSPLAHVRPGLPPTLLIGGGRDELVRLAFAHELRDALHAHGDTVAALDIPWSNHAFDSIPNGTGGQLARYFSERFLNATL